MNSQHSSSLNNFCQCNCSEREVIPLLSNPIISIKSSAFSACCLIILQNLEAAVTADPIIKSCKDHIENGSNPIQPNSRISWDVNYHLSISNQEFSFLSKLLQRSLLVYERFASATPKLAVFCARDQTKGHQTQKQDNSTWQGLINSSVNVKVFLYENWNLGHIQ